MDKKVNLWRRLVAALLNFFNGTDSKASIWQRIKSYFTKEKIMAFLKGEFVKFALKKILGSAAAGGFKAWLVKFIITELYEEIGEPIIRAGLNLEGYTYDKVEGKVLIKKLREADNEADYDSTIDDILN